MTSEITFPCEKERKGILFLISGPSGSGKTTLCARTAEAGLAEYAISATTRKMREGEVQGVSYHFLSVEEFLMKVEEDAFLEHAEVHGNYYGTLKSEVLNHLEEGKNIVMDIDVQGAAQIMQMAEIPCVCIFVMPPTLNELENRLKGRGTDSEDIIKVRLENALGEIAHWKNYDYCLLSSDRETDYAKFTSIISAEMLKTERL